MPCIRQFGHGASAAVAFCDEMIEDESTIDIAARFFVARRRCTELGVHLVDWFACDDLHLRSSRLTLDYCHGLDDWWDVP